MVVDQPHKWLAVLVLLVLSNIPDFILPLEFFDGENMPDGALYVFNIGIDMTVAAFLFKGLFVGQRMPDYAELIGWCFIISCVVHNVFFINEWISSVNPGDMFGSFNKLFYQNSLLGIVIAQWIALFWGGYGLHDGRNIDHRFRYYVARKPVSARLDNFFSRYYSSKQKDDRK